MSPLRLVVLSDTHGRQGRFHVPDGDVLVHCGDLTGRGSLREVAAAARWLASLPHRHKVLVAGNHDFAFQTESAAVRALLDGLVYLEDGGAEIAGLRFWGSPWQPWFYDWAFNLPRGEALRRVWARIPDDTDVLVTHGPPAGILDRTSRGEDVGCADLLDRVRDVRPGLHCFGHIHESHGTLRREGTLYVNASICRGDYEPSNPAIVVEHADGVFRVVPPAA